MSEFNVLTSVLARKNAHLKDDNIMFIDDGHKYIIATDRETTYTSATTVIHSHFEKFNPDAVILNMKFSKKWNSSNKYWGKSDEEIKAMWTNAGTTAAHAGTQLHHRIECFMNGCDVEDEQPKPYADIQLKKIKIKPKLNVKAKAKAKKETETELREDIENPGVDVTQTHATLCAKWHDAQTSDTHLAEWNYFIAFVQHYPTMVPYRTEWCIYDSDLKIAGSIDIVYDNCDGTHSIYDWKRTKEFEVRSMFNKKSKTLVLHNSPMPDTNYWHYALQLNLYRHILQTQYGLTIRDLVLIRLSPDSLSYERVELPMLDEWIQLIIDLKA